MEEHIINATLERMERRAEAALKYATEDTNPETAGEWERAVKHYTCAVEALKEIKQYRAIGTIEECREAREKQIKKNPNIWGDGYDNEGKMIYDMYDCPNCGKSYEIDYSDYEYCPECGQAIDRSNIPGWARKEEANDQ